jgi:hypothetical protein
MSSPSLRLVSSNPAMRHHVSTPRQERAPRESRGSLIRMGLCAAAVPLLWIAHALLHHARGF